MMDRLSDRSISRHSGQELTLTRRKSQRVELESVGTSCAE